MKRSPNNHKDTVPFIITNPVRIDVTVKLLQAKLLLDLPWLEKSFNRATIMSNFDGDGNERIFPVCFVADGKDKFPMIGNDNWSAYSFFVARDTESLADDWQQFQDNRREREMSLYVWVHLDRAQAIQPFEYPEVLKNQIEFSIRNTALNDEDTLIVGDIEDDPLVIFDGFTVDPTKTQMLYHPYKVFRFDLSCTYTDSIVCI